MNIDLSNLDIQYVRAALNNQKEKLQRMIDNKTTTDNVREGVKKDMKYLDETLAKFTTK